MYPNPLNNGIQFIPFLPPDAPDTPEGPLKVFNITPDSASLSWRPPKDGPDDVENYIVEKKDGDTGTWNKVSSFCATPNIKVRNLQQGTEYMFRVSAENQYGSSKPLLSEPIIAKHPFGEFFWTKNQAVIVK